MKTSRIIALLLLLGTAACSDPSAQENSNTTQSEDSGKTQKRIARSDYGEKWPFTVEEGVLKCDQFGGVVFMANGKSYGVNGLANSKKYANLEEVWAFDTLQTKALIDAGFSRKEAEKVKTRISIGQIIEDGLKLCE